MYAPSQMHPRNTYSIIARDPSTGELGGAVQSHWFRVHDVIWAEAGVGVVAVQSLADVGWGERGLELLRSGRAVEEVVLDLLAGDDKASFRQLGILDSRGRAAGYTGEKCTPFAGHRCGADYSCQANLMRGPKVCDAIACAFESTSGLLPERLMAALEAAQDEGGDLRGQQSAAMVAVTGQPTGQPWRDRTIDIRVDDSPAPLGELRRLLTLSRAYNHMSKADELSDAKRFEDALEELESALDLVPDNLEIGFWHAMALLEAGHVDSSVSSFRAVFQADPSWRLFLTRMLSNGVLRGDAAAIRRAVSE